MSVPRGGRRGKREERPGPCRLCGGSAWWNGVRCVAAMVVGVCGAVEYVVDRVRRRVRCTDRRCPAGSWTEYAAGDYPHRTFQLDVVSSAVLQGESESRAAAAEAHLCSRRSVSRWVRWCAGLATPEDLGRVVVRLDPDGLPAGLATPRAGIDTRASRCVSLWERLAAVLSDRGVVLPCGQSGMQRLLCWQHLHRGLVVWLTKSSPPLPVESWGTVM